jgi:hypothetical protein
MVRKMLQMKQMEGKKKIMYRRGKFGFSLYPQVQRSFRRKA